MKKITTLLFDFDRTLRFSDKFWEDYAADYLESIGHPSTPEDRRISRRWTCGYFCSDEFLEDRVNLPNDEDFWQLFNQKFVQSLLSDEVFAKEIAPNLRQLIKDKYYPLNEDYVQEGGIETLEYFKSNGYQMGIITNRQKCIADELEKLDLSDFFPHVVVSGLVGSQKPDPAIFHHALDLHNVSNQECLYIGDNYYADVIGARNAGIEPVLIDPEGFFPEADCLRINTISDLQEIVHSFLN